MNLIQVNWICWGAFGLVWIFGALYNSYKAPSTIKRRARYDWLIFALLAWLVTHYVPHRYLAFATFQITWFQVIGAILLVVSTLFTLWSRWVLGKMWATNAAVKQGHQLVTSGPYSITRNPIYTGVLGMIMGSTISLGQGLAFLVFILALLFFMNRIRNEEQLMEMTFGEQFVQFKNRVPQVFPGFKSRIK
jgi:protein-S-isoprenylcysteine O-methyltransferase Ste14